MTECELIIIPHLVFAQLYTYASPAWFFLNPFHPRSAPPGSPWWSSQSPPAARRQATLSENTPTQTDLSSEGPEGCRYSAAHSSCSCLAHYLGNFLKCIYFYILFNYFSLISCYYFLNKHIAKKKKVLDHSWSQQDRTFHKNILEKKVRTLCKGDWGVSMFYLSLILSSHVKLINSSN